MIGNQRASRNFSSEICQRVSGADHFWIDNQSKPAPNQSKLEFISIFTIPLVGSLFSGTIDQTG